MPRSPPPLYYPNASPRALFLRRFAQARAWRRCAACVSIYKSDASISPTGRRMASTSSSLAAGCRAFHLSAHARVRVRACLACSLGCWSPAACVSAPLPFCPGLPLPLLLHSLPPSLRPDPASPCSRVPPSHPEMFHAPAARPRLFIFAGDPAVGEYDKPYV